MKRRREKYYPLGSISHATMRPEDLIPEFASTLKAMPNITREHRTLACQIVRDCTKRGYYDTEEAGFDLEALFDALDHYAGPFMYFGSHPGDGSDYGFWLCEEWEDLLVNNEEGIKVNDLSEVPAHHIGYIAVVSDHGNVELYRRGRNHRLYEEWSIV